MMDARIYSGYVSCPEQVRASSMNYRKTEYHTRGKGL